MELVTPTTRAAVARALASDDRATLATYGRFLQPIGERLLAAASAAERPALEARLNRAAMAVLPNSSCQ
jgi:hypothetical protein